MSTAATDPTNSIAPGTTLAGKYRLERILGVGGMATVFAATHRNGGRFAIKVLHPRLAADLAMRSRFLREGYAANRVGHAGALRVLDDDVTPDGCVFLVMELLDGDTVGKHASRAGGTLPVADVLAIAHQTLDVLAAAHAKNIVHRDIKPDNLFISRTGVLTVLDFGIARLRESGVAAHETHTGMTLGTPAFMAPEQALGRASELDARTDVWALGASLFQLLTGRFVHRGTTPQEIVAYSATRPAPLLSAVLPDIEPSVAAVIDGALQFEKRDRWADARAMQAAVETAHAAVLGRPVDDATRSSLARYASTIPAVGEDAVGPGGTEVLDPRAASTLGERALSGAVTPKGADAHRPVRRVVAMTAAVAAVAMVVVVAAAVVVRKGASSRPDGRSVVPSAAADAVVQVVTAPAMVEKHEASPTAAPVALEPPVAPAPASASAPHQTSRRAAASAAPVARGALVSPPRASAAPAPVAPAASATTPAVSTTVEDLYRP